ncbi:MAG TPA: NAD(P)-binding domain-containing protein [Gemmatimonadaceae bacterium]|nr:NAD(P)-binding domain-containing protein [Gemmatimonadaceae bacterium]
MIAWLGTGLLGSAFVRAALRRGEKVQVWNRSGDKARALETHGARAFADAAEAVRGAERVHVCLSDDAAVDAVLAQCRAGLGAGVSIVDHTTTSPSGAAGRVKQWAAAGFPFQHAPVFMGPKNAEDATGFMLASGDHALFHRLEPALAPMTGKLLYFGPVSARAAGMKLIGNLFLVSMVAGLTDVLGLAKSQDIPPADIVQLFSKFNPGAMLPARLRRMLEGEYDQPSWNLAMARKDTRLMIEAAQAGDAPLKFIPAVAAELDRWLADGHAAQDWTIISRDVI